MNAQDRAAAARQVQEESNAFARSLINGREPNMNYAREFVEHQVAVTKSLHKPRETDLKTVVRKLREDSETFSRSLEVLPNPNRTDASQPRKKRWAARVRTGCVTCRNRRIKCDEGKPDCKRCALTGRTCVYETPESPKSDASSSASPPPIPPKGLPSPDWHVKEACEYYITVMIPMHGYHAAGDSAYDSSYEFAKLINSMFDPDSFTMLILNHQVQCVSAAHGVQAKFGTLPSLGPVWARLFNQMAISVSNLNRYMALAQDGYFVLHRVCDLINTELSLSIPTWRAHAEGYGALVKSYGGIPALFKLQKPPSIQSQYALVTSSMCNSTSPAHDQIKLMSNWSDEDIRIAYSHTGFHAFPCPTVLLQALIRITHLRTLVITCENVFAVRELVPLAREAFAKIQSFDPHAWDEQYSTKNEFYPVAGEVFKLAVALYGILSLPGPLASVFTYPPTEATPRALADTPSSTTTTTISSDDAYSPVADYYNNNNNYTNSGNTDAYAYAYSTETQDTQLPRECYRAHLYQLFKDALPLAPAKEGLMWPAAVLGVAFSNHEEEEQQTLREYVGRMRWLPGSDGGAFHLLEKLDTFWASGKTGWDQCYDEPINVLT